MNHAEKEGCVRKEDQLCKGPEAELRAEQDRIILFSPLLKATTVSLPKSSGKVRRMTLRDVSPCLFLCCRTFFKCSDLGVLLCIVLFCLQQGLSM